MEISHKEITHSAPSTDYLSESCGFQNGVDVGIGQLIKEAECQGFAIQHYPGIMNLLQRLEINETIPKEIEAVMSSILDWLTELNTLLSINQGVDK
jgi:hypothetical protein